LGNPAIALMQPRVPKPAHFGVVGYAMMSSPDLRTGMDRLVRYLRLVSDAASIVVRPDRHGQWIELHLFGGKEPIPRQRYEYSLLQLLNFGRWMTGDTLKPRAVSFAYPAPADRRQHELAFECPLQFDAPSNALCISEHDMATRLATSMPAMAELHDRVARLALERLHSPRSAQRAQEAIMKRLQDGAPRRAQIAADLCLSDHTFQRRLAEEGTSYSDLVDAARRELAQQYLTQTKVSPTQVAYLLGYADQSNFFRACMRWFGQSPGEYRASVTRQGAGEKMATSVA
jgi:AraC-like DNA-binding protein